MRLPLTICTARAFAVILLSAALFALTCLRPATASPFTLLIPPVDCEMGTDCFIQNYVDQDPGPDYRDYACGRLSYNGSAGTDFRVRNLVAMYEGVNVIACAPGIVRAVRDGMQDISVTEIGKEALKGHYAGNSVAITHDDGWETQYSHLRIGSVRVKPGQRVKTGDVIGQIGLSGLTEFPHVELTVRHDGDIVDPFTGAKTHRKCSRPSRPLWSDDALKILTYRPTGLLGAGFTETIPTAPAVRNGAHRKHLLLRSAPAIIFWIDIFGILAGDHLTISILSPESTVVATHSRTFKKSRAQQFLYVGKRLGDVPWAAGDYTAICTIARSQNGKRGTALRISRRVSIRNDD